MNLDVLLSNAIGQFRDHVALDDGSRRFTFAETGRRLNRLGNALMKLGLAPQERIASLQLNSIETIEVDLTACRFGFVRTLLNWRLEPDDHVYVLNHCGAKVLVFGEAFTAAVDGIRDRLQTVEHFVCVGHPPAWASAYDDLVGRSTEAPPAHTMQLTDLHSIYYTSGTTGQPKGVLLDQRNWLVLTRNHLVDPFKDIGPEDVMLHAAPISHASGACVVPHFVRGARQRILPRFEPGAALAAIEADGVTNTFVAPTMALMMLEHGDHDRTDKSSLRRVFYGGAPMAAEQVRTFMDRWGDVLLQGYGQWEAPQLFTWMSSRQHREALDEGKEHRLASAGVPLSFCRVGVMDDDGRLLPAVAEGEIVTAGDHLMIGYLKNPEATAAERVGEWQRTGDIGRIDPDGFVYLTDRKKDVILTGGGNVYPRQVEEVLYTHPDVLECVALGIPDDRWGEVVHAIVIARPGRTPDADAFLAWARDRLSTDRRPRSVEFVAELPKSNYGKILRRELRERFWQGRKRRI